MKQPTAPAIYPELPLVSDPTVPAETADATQYRISQCSDIKRMFEDEREKRTALYKKYRRGVNTVGGIDTALVCTGMVCGTGGVALLATGIAAPAGLGLGVAAVVCGLLGASSKFVGRRLAVKAKKHNDIRVLAESKLNTIADYVSTAITDGEISAPEFKMILDEVAKYQHMKGQIRSRAKGSYAAVSISQDQKNTLIREGRDQARRSFIQKLSTTQDVS